MKLKIIIALVLIISGCVNHPKLPPDVSGNIEQINSPEMMKNVGN